MKRWIAPFFFASAIILSLSCNARQATQRSTDSDSRHGYSDEAVFNHRQDSLVSFRDRTRELVDRAARLIEKNQKEGAVLDQRWYGLKYFGKHQKLILNAASVTYFGGLESDVRNYLGDRYNSVDPVEENQDTGDIRMYRGNRKDGSYDFIIIGQNGNEVALKTIIRLLYLTKFVDDMTKQKYRDKLASFTQSLQVLLSSVSPRQEFIAFFHKYGISNPDAVFIGFRGDIRPLLKGEGISDPESYTDESLRVNWYPDAHGKKVLLVSIDENRIFASRSGGLVEALFAISAENPPAIIFLGAAGAIEERNRIGKLAAPVSVMVGDPFPESRDKGALIYMIRNRAADGTAIKTADASVESVVVETTAWVRTMKDQRVDTVDQELLHVVRAIHSSAFAHKVDFFAGHVVTDNVSSDPQETDMTLANAEQTIAATSDIRREFFSNVLKTLGILKKETRWMPRRSESPEKRPLSLPAR